jgi:hypothetical protein
MNYDTGVTFPTDVHEWLTSNSAPGEARFMNQHLDEILDAFLKLDISPSSELVHLYVNYGAASVVGWYELNEFDVIEEATEYAHDELGVPDNFIALTSTEGAGVTLYCRETGRIFDVEFGYFDKLINGELQPVGETVVDYLRWCESNRN